MSFCELSNEILGFTKGEFCFGQLSDCHLFKEGFLLWFVSWLSIGNGRFVECVCGTGWQWTQREWWSEGVSVHKFIEESKFEEEMAQDMTNQHNKTFCLFLTLGRKLNGVGPSFCFFAHSSCCSESL